MALNPDPDLCRICLTPNKANNRLPNILADDCLNRPPPPDKCNFPEESQAIPKEGDTHSLTVPPLNRPRLFLFYAGTSPSLISWVGIIGANCLVSLPRDRIFKECSQAGAETPFVSRTFPVFSGPKWTP